MRYEEKTREALLPEAQSVWDSIVSGPRGRVLAPHHILLDAPALADPAQRLGAELRYGASVPPRLTELAILVVAQRWVTHYEWDHHAPLARAAGLTDDHLRAIAAGQEPGFADLEAQTVWALTRELLMDGRLADMTFSKARELFGARGVVELVTLVGYYTLVAFLLNAHQTPSGGWPGPQLGARA